MIKSALAALAIAVAGLAAVPAAHAMPLGVAPEVKIEPRASGETDYRDHVVNVGDVYIQFNGKRVHRQYKHRHYAPRHYKKRGFYNHRGIRYYNGHRGIRYARHGYRHYKGYWFPRKAFSVHVHIGPRHVVPRRHTRPQIIHYNSQHVAWCHGRYKTYRASDNTYAYKVGKRTHCRSPYSR